MGRERSSRPGPPAPRAQRGGPEALKNTTPTAAIRARKKQVWVYDENKNLVNNIPFSSVGKCLEEMGLSRKTFYKYVDTGDNYFGYYYYSKPLK